MSYRIRPDRSFANECRAAAGGELTEAIEALTHRPEGLHEAVHAARKNIKRVRALYRLIASCVPDFQLQENQRLRETARSLSSVRNATALIEISRHLHETAASRDETTALTRVTRALTARRDRLADAETDLEQYAHDAVAAFREALDALNDVSFNCGRRDAARLLQKSWRSNGRKAAKALVGCQAEGHSEQFHDLRKRTQDCWMHHALLRDIWPGAMHARQIEAKALVDVLGCYLDLSMLSEVTDREPDLFKGNDDRARLLDAISARQQVTRQDAFEKARWVYAGKPGSEARTIKRLWLVACD